ncbi:MAG: transposase [Verrucomicrobiaceae bacterium]|nr:transposase [Verrucomicrobiaceae bacterium]
MPSTHACLLYHLVFSTKNRQLMLSKEWRARLHEYLGGMVRGLDGVSLGVGGVADHVHLLVLLKPVHCLADFMRDLKKGSSAWVAEVAHEPSFRWQEGYAAFTVSASAKQTVRDYISSQEEHHRHKSFREELLEFLQKSGVDFDERYLD